jgi:glycosyltransferase involved in cell wall biosynthesis
VTAPRLSVVIPAFDEERALPATLGRLQRSAGLLEPGAVEILVVDNASRDATAEVARAGGARVVDEAVRSAAGARNTGAAAARADVLVFVDADVAVPPGLLKRIDGAMRDPRCIGGAVDTRYEPATRGMRAYLTAWRAVGLATRMAQGACQFCRRDAFDALGGYDTARHIGEDVDFWWRLRRHARRTGGHVDHVREMRVVPSSRRYDQWPALRTIVRTNPVTIALLARHRGAWKGWHETPPR